ncbi:MAG: hypothetical protein AAGK37_15965 [Pseudomonadota bacterium]
MDWVRAKTNFGQLAADPAIGNLRTLTLRHKGRDLTPLHSAPWLDTHDLPSDLAPVERDLSGDFFCAPFGTSDVEPAPPHGWSANSPWQVAHTHESRIDLVLERQILGADISKTLQLSVDAPILYQTHVLTGGSGALSIAHHPMIRVVSRGVFSTSPKRAILTPEVPLEYGRNALANSQRSTDLTRVPAAGGGTADLTHLPIANGTEDFVTLVEAEHPGIGWSAVVRDTEDDIVFCLKDPRVLPITMLWHSNGGRDYPPWSGRHRGVIGIEDGCAAGAAGHRAALTPNPVSREGVPTALPLGGTHRIAHAIGAIARPEGWTRITSISRDGTALILADESGATLHLPFDPDFFTETT